MLRELKVANYNWKYEVFLSFINNVNVKVANC